MELETREVGIKIMIVIMDSRDNTFNDSYNRVGLFNKWIGHFSNSLSLYIIHIIEYIILKKK